MSYEEKVPAEACTIRLFTTELGKVDYNFYNHFSWYSHVHCKVFGKII
jgi:hypothetical protein